MSSCSSMSSDAEENEDVLEAIQVWREAKPSQKSAQLLLEFA
jgi:hypothetical protein